MINVLEREPTDSACSVIPSPLAANPPGETLVDVERLEEIGGGDDAQLRDLLELFFTEADKLMRDLGAAVRVASPREVNRLAHKLCGASATCGMVSLVVPLREMERQAGQGQLAEAGELLSRAGGLLAATRRGVAEYFAAKFLTGSNA